MEREKRSLVISWRIFTKKDIRLLAQRLNNEYKEAQKKKHHSSVTFQLKCLGGISYESDSVEIYDDGGPIDLKKTEVIQMTFYDYVLDRYIDVLIKAGNYAGELSIRGTDKNWVHGNFTNLLEIIESIKPQDNLFLKYKDVILHLIAIGIGSSFYLADSLIFRNIPIVPINSISEAILPFIGFLQRNNWAAYLFILFLLWCAGIFTFAFPIRNWFLDLWPNIEFDFGPQHLNLQKKRRERIWILATLIILPIVVNIVTSLIM